MVLGRPITAKELASARAVSPSALELSNTGESMTTDVGASGVVDKMTISSVSESFSQTITANSVFGGQEAGSARVQRLECLLRALDSTVMKSDVQTGKQVKCAKFTKPLD